ncbi:MAG TPA: hypothetical protein VF729_01880 [Solirubrobacterales bacterium]
MNDLGYRNIWISLGLVMPFLAVGLVLLRDEPEAKEVVGLLALVAAVLLLHVLDRRELREQEDD